MATAKKPHFRLTRSHSLGGRREDLRGRFEVSRVATHSLPLSCALWWSPGILQLLASSETPGSNDQTCTLATCHALAERPLPPRRAPRAASVAPRSLNGFGENAKLASH